MLVPKASTCQTRILPKQKEENFNKAKQANKILAVGLARFPCRGRDACARASPRRHGYQAFRRPHSVRYTELANESS